MLTSLRLAPAATALFFVPLLTACPLFDLVVVIDGEGTVTSVPEGIVCPPDCEEEFESGTVVELMVEPDPGWEFREWSGVRCQQGRVVLDADVTCEARFGEEAGDDDDDDDDHHDVIGVVTGDEDGLFVNVEIVALSLTSVEPVRIPLTDHPAIDNHPDIAGDRVVWSSDRGNGEFDLYLGDLSDVEGTARRLTDDTPRHTPAPEKVPDRHPHFGPDGDTIVFTSKDRPHIVQIEVASECSVPTIRQELRYCEGLNVITFPDGDEPLITPLEIEDSDPGGLWPDDGCTQVGHPSFDASGTRLLFSGSRDALGTVWEVFSAGVDLTDPLQPLLVPGSLRQHTDGPSVGPNPIQMSGGAAWGPGDATILFSSTRTERGNSLLFEIAADDELVSIDALTPLFEHHGNDYVPHAVDDDRILVTSDLGPAVLCDDVPDDADGPTDDLDVVLLDRTTGERTVLGDDDAQETLLIADEVSWFCGLKPNLSACTALLRVVDVEALWLERNADTLIPPDLLDRFGYPTQAPLLYAEGWTRLDGFMTEHAPGWDATLADLDTLDASGFPGLDDADALAAWLEEHRELRERKVVVSTRMAELGIGAPLSCLDADGDGYDVCGPSDPGDSDGNDPDCDDLDAETHPGAAEVECDGVNNDCNGLPDAPDADGDGYDVCGPSDPGDSDGNDPDCDDLDAETHPGAAEVECDGVNNDCNGLPDAPDADGDGYDVCGPSDPGDSDGNDPDCDDLDAETHPDPACTPNPANDQASAVPLEEDFGGSYQACPCAEGWFSVDVPAGANHHVTVYPDPGEGTLAVQVQDASGGVVAVGVAGYGGAVSALWTNSSSGPQQVFVWITLAADAGSTPGTSYAIENFVY